MTLLSVTVEAARLLTIPEPAAVFGSTDAQVTQLRSLLFVAGRNIMRAHDWSELITARTFTCGASQAQSGEPPAAFDRMTDGMEMWNDTNDQIIIGPLGARKWTDLLALDLSTIPQYWRLISSELNIYAPSSGDSIRYEYVSKYWILQAGSTPGSTFSADTDTFVFDETMLTLALVWRWKQAKGFDYAEDMENFNDALADEIKHDKGGLRILSTMDSKDDLPPGRIAYGRVTPVP